MSKGGIITVIIFLVLGLIAVVVYAVAASTSQPGKKNLPNDQNTNPTGGTTGPGSGLVSDADLTILATNFYNSFESFGDSTRCYYMEDANTLTMPELKRFSDIYVAKFGLTPKKQMDNASYWCLWATAPSELYEKLKQL